MNRRVFFKHGLTGIATLTLAGPSHALEFYPNPSDKKWAIVYGTWCGSSRDAAIWISEGMGGIADVFDVRENPDLSSFDHVVIGGSIRGAKVSPALQTFIKNNKGLLKSKIRGYFAICGNRMQPITSEQTTAYIDNHLAKLTGVGQVPAKVFLGRITKSLLDPQSLNIIDNMGIPDYDRMQRQDFLAFGQTLINPK